MILAMSIGNTNFSLGIKCKKEKYIHTIREKVNLFLSREDFSIFIRNFVSKFDETVEGAVISSVNPDLTKNLEDSLMELFIIKPFIVDESIKMNVDLSAYDISLIGSDRISVCEAAIFKYGTPFVVFDFGTATTINVVNSKSCFIGGAILPGIMMGINVLSKDTALLPSVELTADISLIGKNTRECILSGAVFGGVSILEGMTSKIENLLGEKLKVIVTGGNAKYVLKKCTSQVIYDKDLLFEGLYSLYEKN